MGHCLAQLVKGRGSSRALRRLVDAARQPEASIGVRKWVSSVNEDGRRSAKTHALGLLDGLDLLMADAKVGVRRREDGETFVGGPPVGATVEVLQGDLHMVTINLIAPCKVKR